jgi:molybdopterin converting factor subunit 1
MRVLFFAHLTSVTGCREFELRCGDVSTEGLWRKLIEAHPGLAPYRGCVRLARNSEYVERDALFTDADEVALIPPVSGG